MAQKEDEARSLLDTVNKRWRIPEVEKRLRELNEEAMKRWHWLEIYIEKLDGYGPIIQSLPDKNDNG